MNSDDRPAGSQPPQGQPPPQQGYSQPPPQQGYTQPPPQQGYSQPQQGFSQPQPQRQGPALPNMANMADMGKGNPYLVNPDVRLNSIERLTVMLLRLVAWIALLLLVLTLCGDFITFVSSGSISFNSFVNAIVRWLQMIATWSISAVTLLALASIVESLATMRNNRT